jgi:uncharacterized protein YndB with AHSA1/START domain
MTGEVLVEQELEIEAPIETVFGLLTDARGLLEWMAVEAECEPAVGGRLRWRHEDGSIMSGRFTSLEPPRRLAFTYGWEQGGLDVPPGSTHVVIELEERGGVTRLRLVHSRLPEPLAERHRQGWVYFLGRLADRARAGPGTGRLPDEECRR